MTITHTTFFTSIPSPGQEIFSTSQSKRSISGHFTISSSLKPGPAMCLCCIPCTNTPAKEPKPLHVYDVIIIGTGPHGLSMLSALHEPHCKDVLPEDDLNRELLGANRRHGHPRRHYCDKNLKAVQSGCSCPKVLAIDPSGKWMHKWQARFKALGIPFLRSPITAHPDISDPHALHVFRDEWQKRHVPHSHKDSSLEPSSGVFQVVHQGSWHPKKLRGLREGLDTGLFDLPGSEMFVDFCANLVARYPHDLRKGQVKDIQKGVRGNDVIMCDGSVLHGKKIVLATGNGGQPVIPPVFQDWLDNPRVEHTGKFFSPQFDKNEFFAPKKRLMVVGGGLSAVHATLKAIRQGAKVTLCARRPLQERAFDLPLSWFDVRKTDRHMYEFFSLEMKDRPKFLRDSKAGGSVPSHYLELLRRHQARGNVQLFEGYQVEKLMADLDSDSAGALNATLCSAEGSAEGSKFESQFDFILLATGNAADCKSHPLFSKIIETWPCKLVHGLPVLNKDLQWESNLEIFVLGSMGALQLGPLANNLMGGRNGARIVASKLGVYEELEVKSNMYAALFDDDEDSSLSSSEGESE